MSKTVNTAEEIEAASNEGHEIGHMLLSAFNGLPPLVAYNVLGTLVSHIFALVQFEQPQHALEEFDNWAKHTREHLADIVKERMQ